MFSAVHKYIVLYANTYANTYQDTTWQSARDFFDISIARKLKQFKVRIKRRPN